jgi:hypothetical protein
MKKSIIISTLVIIILVGVGGFFVWGNKKNNDLKVEDKKRVNINYPKTNPECKDLFNLGDGYAYYDKKVYYNCEIISETSADYFENLSNGFAKDNKNVFYNGKALEEADAATFKKTDKWLGVFVDKNNGYHLGEAISLQDTKKLIDFLSNDVGGKDLGNNYRLYKNKVYYWNDGGGQAVPSMSLIKANPDTFISLNNNYCKWDKIKYKFDPCRGFGKDDLSVFYASYIIKDADPKTFQILEYSYSKDKNTVFYDTTRLEGVNLETSQIISRRYSKDKSNVYFQNHKISGADPNTFSVVNEENGLAKDKTNYYSREKIVSKEYFDEMINNSSL